MLEYWKFKCRDVHLYQPECSRRICVKLRKPSPICGIWYEGDRKSNYKKLNKNFQS